MGLGTALLGDLVSLDFLSGCQGHSALGTRPPQRCQWGMQDVSPSWLLGPVSSVLWLVTGSIGKAGHGSPRLRMRAHVWMQAVKGCAATDGAANKPGLG